MTTWGRRKDNKQAYPKTGPKGVSGAGTKTSATGDVHMKEKNFIERKIQGDFIELTDPVKIAIQDARIRNLSDVHMKENEKLRPLNKTRVLRIMNETDKRLEGMTPEEKLANYDHVFQQVQREILSEKPNDRCIDCNNPVEAGKARCESCFNVWLNTEGRRVWNNPAEHFKTNDHPDRTRTEFSYLMEEWKKEAKLNGVTEAQLEKMYRELKPVKDITRFVKGEQDTLFSLTS